MGLLRPLLPIPQSRRLQGLEGPWGGGLQRAAVGWSDGRAHRTALIPVPRVGGWEGRVGAARLWLLEMVGA